jgi:flagellar biosynthesis chaperone FliJ
MENLSQRDARWKDIKIGNSTSSIGSYGCTLVCLSMLAGTTPDVVNAFLTAVDGFLVDRIIWAKINETKLGLHFPDMGRQYSYNDVAVREAIERNGGCLVEVDYDGVVATPSDRHWVLYIGNHQLIDPWTGTIRPTSSYPLVKGYAIIEKNNDNNDLSSSEENILQFLREQNADEGKVREAFGALTDKIALQAQIQTLGEKILSLETSHNDLQKQVDDLSLKLTEEEKSGAHWQAEAITAKKDLENELEQNALIDEERKRYKRLYEEALSKFPSQYTWKDLFNLFIKKLKSYDRKS